MAQSNLFRAVLLADITGSTTLYEKLGDSRAARQIGQCIDWLRDTIESNDGYYVAAKGDDVLATFETPDPALAAVEHMLEHLPWDDLSVHAGLHYGQIVAARNDIFGDAVNLTARLANIANPGEALISGDFVAGLTDKRTDVLRPMNTMNIRGKAEPVEVFSLGADTYLRYTAIEGVPKAKAEHVMKATLRFGGMIKALAEGESYCIGRGPTNDFQLFKPWASRKHATVSVANGRVQLTDHSTYGTYLLVEGAVEVVARRETLTVMGSARLSPGTSVQNPDAEIILIEIEVWSTGLGC